MCFFFQAEDGIRDLVRSRGLGDVYKRQQLDLPVGIFGREKDVLDLSGKQAGAKRQYEGNKGRFFHFAGFAAVSYTHLTLPTSDLV